MVPRTLLLLLQLSLAAWSVVANDAYALKCHGVYCKAIKRAMAEIDELGQTVVKGEIIPGFGARAEEICTGALEAFSEGAPDVDEEDKESQEAIFDEKVEELEKSLDAPLQLLYVKQLAVIKEKALQRYKRASKGSEQSDYQAMVASDQYLVKEAEAATRAGSPWEFAQERASLQDMMNELAQRNKKATDVQLKASQQQSTAMQFLQIQQQQLQAMQQQLYGGSTPWNFGAAYRIPDTNINLSGSYQQGRANVQMTCVPDDYAPLLGANGFTHGVGPGNLGLSVNLNV